MYNIFLDILRVLLTGSIIFIFFLIWCIITGPSSEFERNYNRENKRNNE